MPATKKKAIALLTTAAGLAIVIVAGVSLRPWLRSQLYFYWNFDVVGVDEDGFTEYIHTPTGHRMLQVPPEAEGRPPSATFLVSKSPVTPQEFRGIIPDCEFDDPIGEGPVVRAVDLSRFSRAVKLRPLREDEMNAILERFPELFVWVDEDLHWCRPTHFDEQGEPVAASLDPLYVMYTK